MTQIFFWILILQLRTIDLNYRHVTIFYKILQVNRDKDSSVSACAATVASFHQTSAALALTLYTTQGSLGLPRHFIFDNM